MYYDEKIKENLTLIWDNYENLSHKALARLFAICYDNAIRASEHDKSAETEQSFKDTFSKLDKNAQQRILDELTKTNKQEEH